MGIVANYFDIMPITSFSPCRLASSRPSGRPLPVQQPNRLLLFFRVGFHFLDTGVDCVVKGFVRY